MSYIQIEIGPLAKDKDGNDIPGSNLRGLKFNQYAHMLVQEKIDNDHPEASINSALIYGGLKGNCYAKGVDPDFTFEDVCDWLEDISEEIILSVYNVYMNTTAFLKAKQAQEDKKKADQLLEENTVQNATESHVVD